MPSCPKLRFTTTLPASRGGALQLQPVSTIPVALPTTIDPNLAIDRTLSAKPTVNLMRGLELTPFYVGGLDLLKRLSAGKPRPATNHLKALKNLGARLVNGVCATLRYGPGC